MRLILLCAFLLTIQTVAQWSKISELEIGPNGKMASINGVIYVYGDEVYRSTDKGANWEDITSTIPDDLYYLHVHNNKLFGIIGINNVMVSEDNGFTWDQGSSVVLSVGSGAILMLKSDGNLLYALSNRASIFKSSDDGANWEEILISAEGVTNPLPVDFTVVGDIMAVTLAGTGAVVSGDGGSTWSVNNPATALGQVVRFNNEIYGSTYGFYKLNSSLVWEDWNTGIPQSGGLLYSVKGMTVVGNKMFAAVSSLFNGYVYTSNETATSWSETSSGLPAYITTGSVDFMTVSDGELYAYMYGLSAFAPGFTGVYKTAVDISTGVEEDDNSLPDIYSIENNYPNPFNPSTEIAFSLPVESDVTIDVYDILGSKVAQIADGIYEAGKTVVKFQADNLSSGLYIYTISAMGADGTGFSQSRKMMLLK